MKSYTRFCMFQFQYSINPTVSELELFITSDFFLYFDLLDTKILYCTGAPNDLFWELPPGCIGIVALSVMSYAY